MGCKNICKLCDRLILSQSITVGTAGYLTINIPEASYADGEKYCIVLAQSIPDEATVSAPVVITIGDGTTEFPLIADNYQQVLASALKSRTKYSTRVVTTSTAGAFRLLGNLCRASANTLASINENT